MDLENFIEIVKEKAGYEVKTELRMSSYSDRNIDDKKPYAIACTEVVSGYSGGSCWEGGRAERFSSSENVLKAHKDLEKILDEILMGIAPKIGYLQYKTISNLVKTKEDSSYEYYGNSSDNLTVYIIISEFYEQLKTLELI